MSVTETCNRAVRIEITGDGYWIIKNPLFDYFNPLKKDLETDIVIIGAHALGGADEHAESTGGGSYFSRIDLRMKF